MIESNLYYATVGTGDKKLVCFHGFGQNHLAFSKWFEPFTTHFTLYTIDLYYHGKSIRRDGILPFSEWQSDFQSFLKKESIDRFSIAAFSLGGRFALATALLFPKQLDLLILIAPDGIYQNPWFRLATSPLGNKLFKYLMLHPKGFDQFLSTANQLGLSSSIMLRFAQKELNTSENRKRVYRSWTYFRSLQIQLSQLNKVLGQYRVPIEVILGEKDFVIPQKKVTSELRNFPNTRIHLLPLKHHELIEGSLHLIPSLL